MFLGKANLEALANDDVPAGALVTLHEQLQLKLDLILRHLCTHSRRLRVSLLLSLCLLALSATRLPKQPAYLLLQHPGLQMSNEQCCTMEIAVSQALRWWLV